ncbi:MAG: hypothetical protein KAS72_01770 [Phycisphaerales bacterium]|nr:hypothetical protein [Phycisphaerales bacterium]
MKRSDDDTNGGDAPAPPTCEVAAPPPIGSLREVLDTLTKYNTGPENTDDLAPQFLFGPGITVQMPLCDGPVTQLLVTIVEEELGWSVLARICSQQHWKMVDPETGRSFG